MEKVNMAEVNSSKVSVMDENRLSADHEPRPNTALENERTTTKSSRRKRGRARRGRGYKRKPYSQMTWREKRDLEILDEIRDEKREQKKRKLTSIPKDAEGRILNGVNAKDYRPGAPKNTTQYLLEDKVVGDASLSSPSAVVNDDLEFDGETLDDLGTMSAMQQHKQEENEDNTNDLIHIVRKQNAIIESLQQQRAQDVKDSVVMKQRINKLELALRDLNKKFERFRRNIPSHDNRNPKNDTNNDGKMKMGGLGSSDGKKMRRRRRSESDFN